jgi:hypothetical protein
MVFSVFYLFLPAIEKMNALNDQLTVSREMYERIKYQADSAAELQIETNAKRSLLNDDIKKLSIFENTEVHEREFTRFMINNNLKIENVMFTERTSDMETLTLTDIHTHRDKDGGLPQNELLTLILHINAKSNDLDALLKLPEYVNGVYSYRLTQADIQIDLRSEEHRVSYIIEALLRLF